MSNVVVFDSNILIYSIDFKSPFHKRAQELIKQVINGELVLALPYQVLNEFYRVITSNKITSKAFNLKDAVKNVLFFSDIATIIYPTQVGFNLNFELAKKYNITSVKIFDNMLVASMLEYGFFKLYTNNVKDFSFYEELVVTNPFD